MKVAITLVRTQTKVVVVDVEDDAIAERILANPSDNMDWARQAAITFGKDVPWATGLGDVDAIEAFRSAVEPFRSA